MNSAPTLSENRAARAAFLLGDTFTAGLALTGPEVASLRRARPRLSASFVALAGSAAELRGLDIPPHRYAAGQPHQRRRARRLLLKKRELEKLARLSREKNVFLVPLALLGGRRVKLVFAVGRRLKKIEKKQRLKEKDLDRDAARALIARQKKEV